MDFLEGMLQRDKDEFTRICNRLLSNCFICRRNETARGDYYFITRYKEKFTQYLAVTGYRLEINEEYGGRGGGKPEMVQGSLHGKEEKIRAWLKVF